MASEGFSIIKLLRGTFNFASGEVVGKWINIIIILAIIGAVGGAIYKLFIKDTISNQQRMRDQTVTIDKPQVEKLYTGQVQEGEDKDLSIGIEPFGGRFGGDSFYGVKGKIEYKF